MLRRFCPVHGPGRGLPQFGAAPTRHLAIEIPAMTVFDRQMKQLQRDAALRRPDRAEYSYLRAAVAERLSERLSEVKERSFPRVLQLGSSPELTANLLTSPGLSRLVILEGAPLSLRSPLPPPPSGVEVVRVQGDEERLPFLPGSFDLVASALTLRRPPPSVPLTPLDWVNDLPLALHEVRRVLRPDGLFLGALLGESTLEELRSSLLLAEQERRGGVGSHVSPFAGVGDLGNLLVHAGFALPTVDQERLLVRYKDLFALGNDLQGTPWPPYLRLSPLPGMAEQHAPAPPSRPPPMSPGRDVLLAAAALYAHIYGEPAEDGVQVVPASFHLLWGIGWAPAQGQPRPLRRGSHQHSLKDLDALLGGKG